MLLDVLANTKDQPHYTLADVLVVKIKINTGIFAHEH